MIHTEVWKVLCPQGWRWKHIYVLCHPRPRKVWMHPIYNNHVVAPSDAWEHINAWMCMHQSQTQVAHDFLICSNSASLTSHTTCVDYWGSIIIELYLITRITLTSTVVVEKISIYQHHETFRAWIVFLLDWAHPSFVWSWLYKSP